MHHTHLYIYTHIYTHINIHVDTIICNAVRHILICPYNLRHAAASDICAWWPWNIGSMYACTFSLIYIHSQKYTCMQRIYAKEQSQLTCKVLSDCAHDCWDLEKVARSCCSDVRVAVRNKAYQMSEWLYAIKHVRGRKSTVESYTNNMPIANKKECWYI